MHDSLFIEQRNHTQTTDVEKMQLTEEFRQSGMNMKDWCASQGIGYSTFKRWLSRQKTKESVQRTTPGVPEKVSPTTWTRMHIASDHAHGSASAVQSAIRIDVGSIHIHISSETSADQLKVLLQEVMSR